MVQKSTSELDAPDTKSARTRERLLQAAARTLSQRGYAGTRLGDIAEEAGLQAPAIYYYYKSREELLEEVCIVGTIRLREYVRARVDEAPADASALDRIDIAIAAHLNQLMAEVSFSHAVIRNQGQLPPEVRERQQAEEREYAALWRRLFKQAHDEGLLRPDLDINVARLLTVGALNWATEWYQPERTSLTKVIATAQSIIRRGISA
jgi:AcrR family transcriptional regulator